MKPLIIAIVGASGSGKTTLAFHLYEALNIPYVVSYTTRPMRINETNGKDHWFVNQMTVNPSETLAYTVFGGHCYWTLPEQIDANPVTSYVIDEQGVIDLKQKWGERYDVLAVKVIRPDNPTDQARLDRDKCRVPYTDYDCIVINTGSLKKFLKNATRIIKYKLENQLNNGSSK